MRAGTATVATDWSWEVLLCVGCDGGVAFPPGTLFPLRWGDGTALLVMPHRWRDDGLPSVAALMMMLKRRMDCRPPRPSYHRASGAGRDERRSRGCGFLSRAVAVQEACTGGDEGKYGLFDEEALWRAYSSVPNAGAHCAGEIPLGPEADDGPLQLCCARQTSVECCSDLGSRLGRQEPPSACCTGTGRGAIQGEGPAARQLLPQQEENGSCQFPQAEGAAQAASGSGNVIRCAS